MAKWCRINIVFQGTMSEDYFFSRVEEPLGISRKIRGNLGTVSIEEGNTRMDFFAEICPFDGRDLKAMTDFLEKEGHPALSGCVCYSGDHEYRHVWNPHKKEWFYESPAYPSDLTLTDLRDLTAKRAEIVKSRGISEVWYDGFIGETTEDDLTGEDRDVIAQIRMEMLEDDENDSERLIGLYRMATPPERAIMDSVLICLCGWSMKHIIGEAPELEE